MISIDWMALLQVAGVTLGGAFIVVTVVATAATTLDRAQSAANGDTRALLRSGLAWTSFVLFGIAFGLIGFGFYLLIPWWH